MNGFSPFNYKGEGFVRGCRQPLQPYMDAQVLFNTCRNACFIDKQLHPTTTSIPRPWYYLLCPGQLPRPTGRNSGSAHRSLKPLLFWSIDIFINKLANLPGRSASRTGSILLAFMEQATQFRVRGTQALRHLAFTNLLVDMGRQLGN